MHVWTGRILRDFLVAEPEWELLDELGGRTAIFRKSEQTDPDKLWTLQPYVMRRSGAGLQAQARMAASLVRHGHRDELAKLGRVELSAENRLYAQLGR